MAIHLAAETSRITRSLRLGPKIESAVAQPRPGAPVASSSHSIVTQSAHRTFREVDHAPR